MRRLYANKILIVVQMMDLAKIGLNPRQLLSNLLGDLSYPEILFKYILL